jgi:hypothetical protein
MAVFQKLIPVYNRAPIALNITFDGQAYTIEPGADSIPDITIPFAKNQNPIMGSADPLNPHMSGASYLIVEKGDEGFGVPLTDAQWQTHLGMPSRADEQAAFVEKYGNDPKARLIVQGKGRKTTANSRYDAGGSPLGNASFSRKD